MMARTLIQVTDISTGKRQIGPKETLLKELEERKSDLRDAIIAGVEVSGEALSKAEARQGWHLSEFEVRFGVTLTAEAGAIVARAGGEASFEVSVTITREPK